MRLMVLIAVMALVSAGCTHAQRSGHQIYVVSEHAEGFGAALGTGGSGGYDCQEEHEACMEDCWKKRYPWPHNEQQSGWYYKRCTSDCLSQYNKCVDEQEEAARERGRKLEFSQMDRAVEWIKAHKAEIAIGTVVIVGGVAFILAVGGAGAVILAPMAL